MLQSPLNRVICLTDCSFFFLFVIQEFITYVDSIVFGIGIAGVVMVVVIVTTIVTTIRLRKAAAWRSESSSGTFSSREVALTKMLIGNSILFIVCVSPGSLFRFEMRIFFCFLSPFERYW